jgi:outer membrane protein, heavy metal efflux system
MFKRILFTISFLMVVSLIYSQDVNSFLKQISEKNKEILAYQKLLEARKIEARTGLTPSDPFVSFGMMPGRIANSGIKKVWAVNQSFSFPTKYLLERKISKSTIILAEQEFNLGKLQTLLDANLTVLDLIFKEKFLARLLQRKESYAGLRSAWEKMLTYGEATILDYNKIIMELSSLSLDITRTEADIIMLKTKLRFMNGDSADIPEFADYPLYKEPEPDLLISDKALFHPAYIIPEMEYNLSLNEVKLSRTGSLPEFQVGYNSEILPGETYAGPVAGLSIPLWSNSNRVKSSQAKADHYAAMRDAELIRLKSEMMNEFSNMNALKQSINEISAIIGSNENKRFLDIALSNSEISLTTYFSDLEIIYEVEDKLLNLEHEYNLSVARLFDHEILK